MRRCYSPAAAEPPAPLPSRWHAAGDLPESARHDSGAHRPATRPARPVFLAAPGWGAGGAHGVAGACQPWHPASATLPLASGRRSRMRPSPGASLCRGRAPPLLLLAAGMEAAGGARQRRTRMLQVPSLPPGRCLLPSLRKVQGWEDLGAILWVSPDSPHGDGWASTQPGATPGAGVAGRRPDGDWPRTSVLRVPLPCRAG